MLRFTDGVTFDTAGPLRIERRWDGFYVVGNGMMTAVDSYKDGEAMISRLLGVTHRVFVYGTLMSGFGNNRLLSGSRYLGPDVTADEYGMVDMQAFPGVVKTDGSQIKGEVYEVDSATLKRLDRLEGHPTFYRRERIQTASHGEAWMYILQNWDEHNSSFIGDGDWRRHVRRSYAIVDSLLERP